MALAALAKHDNVVVKISGARHACRGAVPLQGHLGSAAPHRRRLRLDRCMWGTDWTRAVAFLTCKEGVDAFRLTYRLSDSERATLMGGTLEKVYGWAPSPRGR